MIPAQSQRRAGKTPACKARPEAKPRRSSAEKYGPVISAFRMRREAGAENTASCQPKAPRRKARKDGHQEQSGPDVWPSTRFIGGEFARPAPTSSASGVRRELTPPRRSFRARLRLATAKTGSFSKSFAAADAHYRASARRGHQGGARRWRLGLSPRWPRGSQSPWRDQLHAELVLIARNVHIAFVAVPGCGLRLRGRSSPAVRAAWRRYPRPSMFAAMFITIAPIAGWSGGTSGKEPGA